MVTGLLNGERVTPKMPVPDLIRDGCRFSEKIMRKKLVYAARRTSSASAR